MERLKRASVIIDLADELLKEGSWCGETHLQKITFFLQDLLKVPLDYDFILYKHGPFSFDLCDELTAMRADRLMEYVIKMYPYGPSLVPTKTGRIIKENFFQKTIDQNKPKINFISSRLGNKGVAELEKLGTALFVTLKERQLVDASKRAQRINSIKPHISLEEATTAIREVDQIIHEANVL
ncbi:hypothetical protein JW926_12885 [Candidatus Sumerlaeota bacterium]|nr:hypothetical protein [Candidatus Sumerlaeota bacterium]